MAVRAGFELTTSV